MLDDRQAEAGAAQFARAGFVDAVEPLEDALLIVRLDADAGVGDGEVSGRLELGLEARSGCRLAAPRSLSSLLHAIVTLPPSGVYLIALSMRLSRISRRPSRSARHAAAAAALVRLDGDRNAFRLGGAALVFEARAARLRPRRPTRSRTPDDPTRCGPASACRGSGDAAGRPALRSAPRNRWLVSGSFSAPLRSVSVYALIELSGVFSSCETLAMKSRRIDSSRRSSVVSCITSTTPGHGSPGSGCT